MSINETPAFKRAYAEVEQIFCPHGVPAYADRSRVEYRITRAALDMLRRSGAFSGDPDSTARELSNPPLLTTR